MTDEQAKFLQRVAGPALEFERESNAVPAPIAIAQAILESGWGKSTLATLFNNFFGIKNSHRQGAGVDNYTAHDWQTTEFIHGHAERVRADFQDFPSPAEAFHVHTLVLTALHRYQEFCRVGNLYIAAGAISGWRPEQLLGLLARAAEELGPTVTGKDGKPSRGYSTDPKYADELMALIREFHLNDRAVLKAYAAGGQKAMVESAAIPLTPETTT